MESDARLVLSVCAGIFVAAVLHALVPGLPAYYPLEHEWRWQKTPGVAMHWYGRSLWTLLGGALAFAVARFSTARMRSDPPPWLLRAAMVGAIASLLIALGLVARHEWSSWMTRAPSSPSQPN